MRRFSAHVQALLRNLSWYGHRARRLDPADAMKQLAEAAEPGALRAITPYLFVEDDRAAAAASESANRLVPLLPPGDIAAIDGMVRESYWIQTSPRRDQDAALRQFRIRAQTPAQTCLWSMHPSGFVRQAAVAQLRCAAESWVLPFLLTRLNDWVEPVRAEARAAVASRLSTSTVDQVLCALPAIVPLLGRGRADHEWVFNAASAAILSPDARPQLRQAMRSKDKAFRRAAFSFALRVQGNERESLMQDALASRDAVLRLRAARGLLAVTGGGAREELIRRLVADPFMPVRREGLYAAASAKLPVAEDLLGAALLDAHSSVRHLARVYLRDFGFADPASFYRAKLSDAAGADAAAAVDGLGETGAAPDVGFIRGFLADPRPRVRAAAVRASAHLLGDGASPELLPLLADSSPRVARAAARSLRPGSLDARLLDSYLALGRAPHTRRYALRLLASADPVRGLAAILNGCAAPDPLLSRTARVLLRTWRLGYQRPAPAGVEAAQTALEQARPHLSPEELTRAERAVRTLSLAGN